MSPETIDTLITALITGGLVLAGLAALAALPWRRTDVDAAHRAGVGVTQVGLVKGRRLLHPAAEEAPARVVHAKAA